MNLLKTYGGHLMAIVTVVIWGTTFVSTKVLINNGLAPVEILVYRFIIAYVCIWFISPRKLLANSWRDELLCLLIGLTGGSLYFIAENTAIQITMATNVGLIISVTPVVTALVYYLFNRQERPGRSLITGSLVALAGVTFVVFNGSFHFKLSPIGDLLTLTAALMWAFYCLISRMLSGRYPTVFITRKVFFYGVITVLPMLFIFPPDFNPEIMTRPVVIMNLLFLGVIASMLCYLMWNLAVKQIGTMHTANYLYVTPLVTMFTSALVIDEPVTFIALLGCALILGGVYLAGRK